MNDGKIDWAGNFPAVVTPFTKNGAIDAAKFAANLELLIDEGVHGLVVSGCTGEAWALSPAEKLELFRLAAEVAAGRVRVVGGTGGIATRDVIELSFEARTTGIDGVMILPPYYAMPTRAEAVAHYRAISDAVAFPIMVYNIPSRTGLNLAPGWIEELAGIEWVVALKESHSDFPQLEAVVARCGERIRVFSGFAASRGVAALVMGCAGLVSSMDTQVMGRDAISIYDLVQKGLLERARPIQQRALLLVEELHHIGSEASSVKAAMNLVGRPGGSVRAPHQDLEGADLARIAAILERHGLNALAWQRSSRGDHGGRRRDEPI